MTIRRRMRFEVMGNSNELMELPKIFTITAGKDGEFKISASEEEKEVMEKVAQQIKENKASGKEPLFNIPRNLMKVVNKFFTPFTVYANEFISAQQGRGNSTETIKHYEQTIRKLEQFFCWIYCYQTEENFHSYSKEERIKMGESIPFGILEYDGFDAEFREFLIDEEEVSEQTVATYFRDYRAIAYWGMDEGMINKRNIVVKTVYSEIKDCYTDEEIDILLKKPPKDANFAEYRSWVVINWVLATGNRVGTIVNVKIKDVNFDDNTISINSQKNKRVATIALVSPLRKILKEYIEEWLVDETGEYITPYLFPSSFEASSNMPMTRQSMGRAIANYNASRGIKKTSIHLFRHTYVKNWILKGGDLHSLQLVLGHSSLNMVVHYANMLGKDLKPKMEDYSLLATHKTKNKGKMIKRREKK